MLELKHKNLDVWKASIDFVKEVYLITGRFPESEKYGLISQLRRASVSVPSNISEGASRSTHSDRKRFFIIARSSLVEADTQIELSIRLGLIDQSETENLSELANKIFAMLSNMIRS
ncbi:MAG: four helix bundle protein [Balneolaceae bacterium]|nr:four helix bundle protein [Balneolaceae bacterium]MCH8548925.1 four helix bundle protein [Balneolaceae bacterium]